VLPRKQDGRALLRHAEDYRLPNVPMISIVDDDQSVRESTKELVEALGYEALAFASAEEFLDSERVSDTSCLITDLQMRGLSGVDLQRRLVDEGRGIPIIFITAFPDEKTRSSVLNAGAIGFLSKPFSDDKLIHHLNIALADFGSGTVKQ
jgi:FixJ family two-component response regulator